MRDGIIRIVDGIAPTLHVGMHAALQGEDFPPFDELHDIGRPTHMQRRPMQDDIHSWLVVRIPLNVVRNRIPIKHRDLALIADHGDERQELTEAGFHFSIGERKGLGFLDPLADHYHILEPALRPHVDFFEQPMPTVGKVIVDRTMMRRTLGTLIAGRTDQLFLKTQI